MKTQQFISLYGSMDDVARSLNDAIKNSTNQGVVTVLYLEQKPDKYGRFEGLAVIEREV